MSGTECVILRFVTTKKSRQSAVFLDRMKLIASSGQYLVRVSLMADVPDELVARRIKNVVHRHRELDRSETCSCVASDPRAGVDNELANLVGNFLQILDTKLTKVGG